MERTTLILQSVTAIAVAVLALVTWQEHRARSAADDAADRYRSAADGLLTEGAFEAAALARERAARLTVDPHAAEADLDAAARARLTAAVRQVALPSADRLRQLEAMGRLIASAEHADSAALAAAVEVLALRVDGNLDAAAARVKAAEDAEVRSPWLDWQMGAVRLRQGRPRDAITRLEALVKAEPAFGPGLHRLGLAYLADNQREGAIGALQRAIEAGQTRDAALDLARVFLGQQMWAEAIPHLQTVLRGQGGHTEALRLLAAAHFRLGRHELAARTYRQAHTLDNDPRTLFSAAIALGAGGKHGEALAILDTLLPRAAQLPEVAYQRGKVLLELNRNQEARVAFEGYLAVATGRASEAQRIAEVRQLLGQAPRQPTMPAPGQPTMPAPGQPTMPAPGQPAMPAPGQPAMPAPGQPAMPSPAAPGPSGLPTPRRAPLVPAPSPIPPPPARQPPAMIPN